MIEHGLIPFCTKRELFADATYNIYIGLNVSFFYLHYHKICIFYSFTSKYILNVCLEIFNKMSIASIIVFVLYSLDVEAKRGVKFRHCTRNVSREKRGTKCLNTRHPLPTLLCGGSSVRLKKILPLFLKYIVFTK